MTARIGILSRHEDVASLEHDIIAVVRPYKRKGAGPGSKKGGFFIEVVNEVQHRMDERDIAVGALRMIAGEVERPPYVKTAGAVAKDALACVRMVGWPEERP